MSVTVNESLRLSHITVTAPTGEQIDHILLEFEVVAAGQGDAQLWILKALDAVKVAVHLLKDLL